MPEPGDLITAFSPQPGRCFRMLYSRQLQATHCRGEPAWKGVWRDRTGKSWYVEACRHHCRRLRATRRTVSERPSGTAPYRTSGLGAGRSSGTVSPALSGRVSSPVDQTQGDRPGRPPSARRSSIRRFRSMGGSLSSGLLRLLVDPSGGGPGVDPNQTITTARGWGEVRAAHPGRGNHARATGRHLREGARRRVARVDEVAPH
jgi:hypothetical protein